MTGIWEPFGYSKQESDRLEGIVLELVQRAVALDEQTARRAIAAVTWRELAREILTHKKPRSLMTRLLREVLTTRRGGS